MTPLPFTLFLIRNTFDGAGLGFDLSEMGDLGILGLSGGYQGSEDAGQDQPRYV